MFEETAFSDRDALVKGMEACRESLHFILDRYFHPQTICANPGGECQRIDDTLRFLARNLEREENIMILSGYAKAEAHNRDHAMALKKLEKLKNTLVCGRYDNADVAEFLESWVDDHTRDFDKPLEIFLRG